MFQLFQFFFFFLIIKPTISPLSHFSFGRVRLAGPGRILLPFSLVHLFNQALSYISLTQEIQYPVPILKS